MTEPRQLVLKDLPRCKALHDRFSIENEVAKKLCVGPPTAEQMEALIHLLDDECRAWAALAMRLEAENVFGDRVVLHSHD